jgi:uncharacterized protein YbjT (DUF2867 family)
MVPELFSKHFEYNKAITNEGSSHISNMLALTGTTGKIGGAVLKAIIDENLLPLHKLVICTSSNPEDEIWASLKLKGVKVRHSNYDDFPSMVDAFHGCSKLFLVSTPRIEMDFNQAPHGEGREKHHFAAIRAAREAGVNHIYYTSLAFGSKSNAGVMQAHLRTEAFLRDLKGLEVTIMREGLYNESWPLYFGYYYDLKQDDREEIVVAGDGRISWTSVADLGLVTALIINEPSSKYVGRTLYLSAASSSTLEDIAAMVSKAMGREVHVKVVSRDEYVDHYVEKGRDRASVEWWASTYAALTESECSIDDGTFTELMLGSGRENKPIDETVTEMLSG